MIAKTFRFILLMLVPSFFSVLQAQNLTKPLTLEQAVQQAVTASRAVQLAQTDEKIAGSRFKSTEAFYLPSVSLSYSGFTTNQPLNAFGFKLQQAKVEAADFNPAQLNHPGNIFNTLTQLSIQQPLFNADLNQLRKAAAKETEAAGFISQRTREGIALQVKQIYLQLVFTYQARKVMEETITALQAMEKFTGDRYQQGLLQKSDWLLVQVQVKNAETQLAEIISQISILSDQLSLLMNSTERPVYTVTDVSINNAAADTVPMTRADVKAMIMGLSGYDLMINSTKQSMLPRLNAFANYQLNDKKLLGFGANGYFAGVQLSWDIFKGNQNKNKIITQGLEKNRLQQELSNRIEKDNLEIRKAKQQLNDAAYRTTQQQKGIEQATEALRILRNRFSQGLVNTTDVLIAETQLAQQQLQLAQTKMLQKVTAAYLEFLTATE
jgi:outer membrane protein TolC